MNNNKVTIINRKFLQKNTVRTVKKKKKNSTNSILFTDIVTAPKQDHKQQSHYDKQKSRSKKLCKNSKRERSNSTTNALIEEKLDEFNGKNKEEYYKYKQCLQ